MLTAKYVKYVYFFEGQIGFYPKTPINQSINQLRIMHREYNKKNNNNNETLIVSSKFKELMDRCENFHMWFRYFEKKIGMAAYRSGQ